MGASAKKASLGKETAVVTVDLASFFNIVCWSFLDSARHANRWCYTKQTYIGAGLTRYKSLVSRTLNTRKKTTSKSQKKIEAEQQSLVYLRLWKQFMHKQ